VTVDPPGARIPVGADRAAAARAEHQVTQPYREVAVLAGLAENVNRGGHSLSLSRSGLMMSDSWILGMISVSPVQVSVKALEVTVPH
jgi:hypothetical protein